MLLKAAIEATLIKTSNPALCHQKEFVYLVLLKDCTPMMLNFIGLFPIMAWLFPINIVVLFLVISIFDVLLDECQTKSFFEEMNILVEAILQFCTTNQLFKKFTM